MRIIPRHEWGARYPDGFRNAPLPAREVWLHHTAGPAHNGPAVIRDLERVGQQRFGGGMSYTFLITINGDIYEGHSIHRQGAHTGGRNDIARAICYVGNYENIRPSEAQLDSTVWLLREGERRGWWRAAHLTGGHRDVKATACPGVHAYRLISEVNRRAATSPSPSPPPQEDDMPTPQELWDYNLVDRWSGKEMRAGQLLGWIGQHVVATRRDAATNAQRLAAQSATIDKLTDLLASQQGADADEIKAAVRQAIEESVLDVDITVAGPGEEVPKAP